MSSYSYILYRSTASGSSAMKVKQPLLNYLYKNNVGTSQLFRQITTASGYSTQQAANASKAPASAPSSQQPKPSFDQNPPKKSRSGLKFAAFALTGFTLGLGYVTLNPESRRQVEATVPQSKMVFDLIDDMIKKINADPVPVASPPSKLPSGDLKPIKSEPPKPIVPAATSQSAAPAKSQEAGPAATPAPKAKPAPAAAPAKQTQTQQQAAQEKAPAEAPSAKKEDANDLDWRKAMRSNQLKLEANINTIETKLVQMLGDVKLRVAEALNSSYVSIESLNNYRQALRKALDDDNLTSDVNQKEVEWRKVTDLFDLQSRDVNETNQKIVLARKTVEDLDRFLKEVKLNDELFKNVKNLRETQVELLNQARLLQNEQAKLAETIIHANVLKNYTSEQKLARAQFLKEIQSLQPEGLNRTLSSGDQLSNDELNSLLIHAHKRVLQLQKQIEKMQLKQNKQIQEALEEQQKQNELFRIKNDQNLYELNQKEFQIEKDKIIENENVKANEMLKRELARQAAAHNNHLAEMLRIQHDELESAFNKKLLVELDNARKEFYSQVASSMGRVKGIEHALNQRANFELQANNAKQLWLAIQSINELLTTRVQELNKDPSATNENLIGALTENVRVNLRKIQESATDNEFIQKIVKTTISLIDAEQAARAESNSRVEIWSEPDLKERFSRLKELCNRVALIDDRGGSLFKYFISYVQSFFIVHHKVKPQPVLANASDEEKREAYENFIKQIDATQLNTFNILDYSEYFVENGNFLMALKLMQQLKGEPLRVARDWINDALLLVEIKQASTLLNAYISSIYIGTRVNHKK